MTTDTRSLLAAIVFIFCAAALVWWLLGLALRLAPRVSALLGLANLLLAAALQTDALRGGGAPDWMANWGSDLLGVAGFVALRASVPVVDERPPAWRLGLALLLVAGALLAWLPYGPQPHRQLIIVYGCISLLAAASCIDALRLLRRHVRLGLALGLVLPLLLVTAVVTLPLGQALLWPAQSAALSVGTDFNTAWLWLALLMCLLMNTTMAFLVLTRLVLRIQRLTRHDPLTDALNRRAFSEALESAHARLQRGPAYAVLLLDLDRFKALNDGLGHAAGDAALCQAAAALRAGLRASDVLGRLGGEEFGVLLPLTDGPAALRVAERLRARLETLLFEWRGRPWPLSVSIGMALAASEDESAEAVLQRADRAMYAAKAAGRNCVREA